MATEQEKFKICPSCGERNPPTLMDCAKCGMDISRVKQTSPAAPPPPAAPETAGGTDGGLARVCDNCHHANPSNARKCAGCGEDISDVRPAAAPPPLPRLRCTLSALDGGYAFTLPDGEKWVTVGRENLMREYLADKVFVSRDHAGLHWEGGKLWVQNHSRNNGTFVNGERIGDGSVELRDGDTLFLGGKEINGQRDANAAYFKVAVG